MRPPQVEVLRATASSLITSLRAAVAGAAETARSQSVLQERLVCCCEALHRECNVLLAALLAHQRELTTEARAEEQGRLKVLQDQFDDLDVSIDLLDHCVRAAQASLTLPSGPPLLAVHSSLTAVIDLATNCDVLPCAPSWLLLSTSPRPFINTITQSLSLAPCTTPQPSTSEDNSSTSSPTPFARWITSVDVSACTLKGLGIVRYAALDISCWQTESERDKGPARAHNWFILHCNDSWGQPIHSIRAEEVVACIAFASCGGGGRGEERGGRDEGGEKEEGPRVWVTPLYPGVFRITYTVPLLPAPSPPLLLSLTACLSPLPLLTISPAATITGVWRASLPLPSASGNYGIAVSSDGSLCAVSQHDVCVSLFSLPDWERKATLNKRGPAAGAFWGARKMCFTSRNTLLVAEFDNKRVQELSPEGVHIRFIGDGVFDSGPCSICTNDVVVITGKAGYRDRSDGRILVFDYDTGSLLRVFGQYGNKPGEVSLAAGIRITPDNRYTLIADPGSRRLHLFTLDGTFVRWIPCPGLQFPDDVDFAPSGDIIIADSVLCRVSVLSADGSRVLRHFGSDGDSDGMFLAPTALATVQDTLYILDMRAHRVQVFQ